MLVLILNQERLETQLKWTHRIVHDSTNLRLLFSPLEYLCGEQRLAKSHIEVQFPVRFAPWVKPKELPDVDALIDGTHECTHDWIGFLRKTAATKMDIELIDPTPTRCVGSNAAGWKIQRCKDDSSKDQMIVLRIDNGGKVIMTVEQDDISDSQQLQDARRDAEKFIQEYTSRYCRLWMDKNEEESEAFKQDVEHEQMVEHFNAVCQARALGLPRNLRQERLTSGRWQRQTWVIRKDGSLRPADVTLNPQEKGYFSHYAETEIWYQILEGELVITYDVDNVDGDFIINYEFSVRPRSITTAQYSRILDIQGEVQQRTGSMDASDGKRCDYRWTWTSQLSME